MFTKERRYCTYSVWGSITLDRDASVFSVIVFCVDTICLDNMVPIRECMLQMPLQLSLRTGVERVDQSRPEPARSSHQLLEDVQ